METEYPSESREGTFPHPQWERDAAVEGAAKTGRQGDVLDGTDTFRLQDCLITEDLMEESKPKLMASYSTSWVKLSFQ